MRELETIAFGLTVVIAAACSSSGTEGDAGTDETTDTTTTTDAPQDALHEPDAEDAPDDTGTDPAPEPVIDVSWDIPDSIGDGYPCPSPEDGFDETEPGINMMFMLSSVTMMGMDVGMAVGSFMTTAREDFDAGSSSDIPLDTCVVGESAPSEPECETDADCAPEQVCLPETDDAGEPIPDTERCVTPREPLDLGPFTVTGFNEGPLEFQYNPGQQGAYTATISADGQLDPALLAYDCTYLVEGEGDESVGLGPIMGLLDVPPYLELTSPEATVNAMGLPEISVDVTSDLELEWNGASGEGTLLISLAGMGGGVTCLASDDGAFTVPADMVEAAGLGDFSFFNMLTLTHEVPGLICGEGLTVSDAKYSQVVMYNVAKADSAD
jgi:hypothetical protein